MDNIKYSVELEETYSRKIIVEAETKWEALEKAIKIIETEEPIISRQDLIAKKFKNAERIG